MGISRRYIIVFGVYESIIAYRNRGIQKLKPRCLCVAYLPRHHLSFYLGNEIHFLRCAINYAHIHIYINFKKNDKYRNYLVALTGVFPFFFFFLVFSLHRLEP